MNIQTQILDIFYNIIVIWSTATLLMLVYSVRSNKQEFDLFCWFATNRKRFAAGGLIVLLLSVLTVISPDINALLSLIGFNADKTPVGLGMAVGVLLIAGVSGNPGGKPVKN